MMVAHAFSISASHFGQAQCDQIYLLYHSPSINILDKVFLIFLEPWNLIFCDHITCRKAKIYKIQKIDRPTHRPSIFLELYSNVKIHKLHLKEPYYVNCNIISKKVPEPNQSR